MPSPILSDHTAFRDAFLEESPSRAFDRAYGPALRVLLYYVWRGCTLARSASLLGKAPPYNALIALSAYKGLLPIIQLIRLGYHGDALALARGLMERIALVGYLGANRELISRYIKGEILPYRAALSWAKRESLQNWMVLYGALTNVAHSRVEGVAGHIFDATPIGVAFREIPLGRAKPAPNMTEELLGLVVYSLLALDPLALSLVNEVAAQPLPNDESIVAKVGLADAKQFLAFLEALVQRYKSANPRPKV